MIAYQYDSAGHYVGETVADESPLEPGKYLLPARCTLTPPPADVPADKTPRWNGTAWDVVTKPSRVADDPAAKIRSFLEQNPDVAAYLAAKQGGV